MHIYTIFTITNRLCIFEMENMREIKKSLIKDHHTYVDEIDMTTICGDHCLPVLSNYTMGNYNNTVFKRYNEQSSIIFISSFLAEMFKHKKVILCNENESYIYT